MNRPLLLRTVFLRPARFRLRTLFMAVGITVSVAASMLLQTFLGGARDAFASFVGKAYPSDCVTLMAGTGFMGGGEGRSDLTLEDVETVLGSLSEITDWDPAVAAGARDVKQAGLSTEVGIVGHSERSAAVRRRSVREGEFFTTAEVRGKANVAILGPTTAAALFPDESPVGERIFIDNIPFEVKGVLESFGVDPHGNDQDDIIYVPYTVAMDTLLKADYISAATFQIEDRSRAEEVREEVTGIMRRRHHIGEGQEDDFSVLTAVLIQELIDRSFRTFDLFVLLIAGTAFLMSTLVIGGIMWVGVKQRVAEIGLRKAVGARSRDVQIQILLEALAVTAVAAVAGVLLALAGSAALAPLLASSFGVAGLEPPTLSGLVAVGAALVLAVVGGALPARRAARLDPVAALR